MSTVAGHPQRLHDYTVATAQALPPAEEARDAAVRAHSTYLAAPSTWDLQPPMDLGVRDWVLPALAHIDLVPAAVGSALRALDASTITGGVLETVDGERFAQATADALLAGVGTGTQSQVLQRLAEAVATDSGVLDRALREVEGGAHPAWRRTAVRAFALADTVDTVRREWQVVAEDELATPGERIAGTAVGAGLPGVAGVAGTVVGNLAAPVVGFGVGAAASTAAAELRQRPAVRRVEQRIAAGVDRLAGTTRDRPRRDALVARSRRRPGEVRAP